MLVEYEYLNDLFIISHIKMIPFNTISLKFRSPKGKTFISKAMRSVTQIGQSGKSTFQCKAMVDREKYEFHDEVQ